MDNVSRVLAHAATRLAGTPDAARRILTLVPARDGRPYRRRRRRGLWRTYLFIERTRTYDIVETPAQAEAAARAFGQFQALLADLPGARLHDTDPRLPPHAEALRRVCAGGRRRCLQPRARLSAI